MLVVTLSEILKQHNMQSHSIKYALQTKHKPKRPKPYHSPATLLNETRCYFTILILKISYQLV